MSNVYSLQGQHNINRQESFWLKVDNQGKSKDECWEWLGGKTSEG